MKQIVSLILILAGITTVGAAEISGRIFCDANHNGYYDRGEKLLQGVGVSDGDTVVWSDRKGRFALDAEPGTMLFPILPDGYASSGNGLQNDGRRFVGDSVSEIDFGLLAATSQKKFRVAVVGDVQVDSQEQLDFACRTVLGELATRTDLDWAIHMGDMVNDKPQLLEPTVEAFNTLPLPVWAVIGNHDLDVKVKPRTSRGFQQRVGNDIAALFRGNCCFILLNNVEFYDKGLSDAQLRFMRQIIGRCPKSTLIVLCQHVPMSGVKNRESVFDLLDGRRALILSAHAHTIFRKEWSPTVSEVSVGASCGSWWTGERDAWGIPLALQQCGSPRNYFVFDFDGADYTFRFKGVGMDERIQSDLWIAGEDKSDEEVGLLDDVSRGEMRLNVYGGGEATSVEWSVDGTNWQPMDYVKAVAPVVSRIVFMNKEGGYPTHFSRRTPLRRKASSAHLWSAQLPDSLQQGDILLRFRVTDECGLVPFRYERPVTFGF